MSLIYRELTPAEFPLAPREVPGTENLTPETAKIIAAINEKGEVVSTFTMFACVHLEPMWIREDYRHSPSILRRMDEAMKKLCRENGVRGAYTVTLESTPVLARFAEFFGCKRVSGTLWRWIDGEEG